MADKSTKNLGVQEAARRITERKNKVMQIVDDAAGSKKAKSKKGARKKSAPSVSEIKKSKHTGSKGETSYGQRMNEPAVSSTKTRFGQSGNSGDY